MLFVTSLTVPAGTPENNPIRQELELEPGTIKKINVYFPPGCHATVKVRIKVGDIIFLPANPEEWLVGNGEALEDEPYRTILDSPVKLTIEACSPSASYDHTIYVRVLVLPPDIVYPEQRLAAILEEIADRLKARVITE